MDQQVAISDLPTSKLAELKKDPLRSAATACLVYVNDRTPGIVRVKKGKQFQYWFKNKPVNNKKQLLRIKRLAIPPAWRNVWICPKENGHLQATGFDVSNRKQYKYHSVWNLIRNHTKYAGLCKFGRTLPLIRKQLQRDLALPGMCQRKVLALVVSLMEITHIRIGNESYEKLHGSYGLTTLKDKHVKIVGKHLHFIFTGKKGIKHNIVIHHKRFASLVKKCRDIPGRELFQYIDEHGHHKAIDSGMINNYIKEISGCDFSAKDFRTWWGTINALMAFKELPWKDKEKGKKKIVVEALDHVAKQLGNTRSVCKKYYVHPVVIDLFERDELKRYFKTEHSSKNKGLSTTEKVLVRILEKAS